MKEYLSKNEIRQELGCSMGYVETIIKGIRSNADRYGDLPVAQCGKRTYVKSEILEDYLQWSKWLDNPILKMKVPPYRKGGNRRLSEVDKDDIADRVVDRIMEMTTKKSRSCGA